MYISINIHHLYKSRVIFHHILESYEFASATMLIRTACPRNLGKQFPHKEEHNILRSRVKALTEMVHTAHTPLWKQLLRNKMAYVSAWYCVLVAELTEMIQTVHTHGQNTNQNRKPYFPSDKPHSSRIQAKTNEMYGLSRPQCPNVVWKSIWPLLWVRLNSVFSQTAKCWRGFRYDIQHTHIIVVHNLCMKFIT